ncbi:MAG: hypothetical protein K9M07_00500 [Simkaniaceae bacterium]|nr:hypothetical protein [Simkaniaceae bacterium]
MKDYRAAAALPYQSSLVGHSTLAMPSSFGSLRFDLALPRSLSESSFLRKVSYEEMWDASGIFSCLTEPI